MEKWNVMVKVNGECKLVAVTYDINTAYNIVEQWNHYSDMAWVERCFE